VARAGEVGAVTIATNMAGRGVDIKLGGELDEETLAQVHRVLRQNGISSYDLSFEQMAEALRAIEPERYYLYKDAVGRFLKHVEDEAKVKTLGGLHVIGTERHEARRIDNQLRGRAGRQGDPGSSTFYLSLEDDLMRRFGGSRAADLAARLGAEDDMPVSLGIVSRAIANAQTQVEGHNFDVRKHLLEYDDVLNTQRKVVYEQRKRILSKPDLRKDVWAMVESEIKKRVDAAFGDEGEEPDTLRLVLHLERIQPTTTVAEGRLFPSFTLGVVLSVLPVGDAPEKVRTALSEVGREALDSQRRTVLDMVERVLTRSLQAEDESVERLLDAAAMALEGAEMESREAGRDLSALEAAEAVSRNTGLSIDGREMRGAEGRELERALVERVRAVGQAQARQRTLAQVAARAGADWSVPASVLTETSQDAVVAAVMAAVEEALTEKMAALAQEIEGEIENRVRRPEDCTEQGLLRVLQEIRYGTRTQFDSRHRRVSQQVERFHFAYWAAAQIADWERERIESEILTHLQDAIVAWEDAWGGLEMQRISANRIADLDEETRSGLAKVLGDGRMKELSDLRVSDLSPKDARLVRDYLGERVLVNVQRQLMLEVTSRYWVEHLTAMEELRTGIGLQSYAQKDPLAEYKVRAYEMFQELFAAIQSDIVMAMFVYRPRDLSEVRVGVERRKTDREGGQPAGRSGSGKSKRSRRRRKRKR